MIRQATILDLDALVRLEQRAFDSSLYFQTSRHSLQHLLTRAHADILVAQNKDEILASAVLLYRRGSGLVRFYSLAVEPALQGKGIGGELFNAAEKHAADIGKTGMICEIRADNKILYDRYIKKGYSFVRGVADYYPDGTACIKMKKMF